MSIIELAENEYLLYLCNYRELQILSNLVSYKTEYQILNENLRLSTIRIVIVIFLICFFLQVSNESLFQNRTKSPSICLC